MSIQPTPTNVQPSPANDTTTTPNEQAWNQTLSQYIAQGAIPLLESLGFSEIQQSTQNAGDN